ncbi:hypothetical protein [Mariniblastus fucicola]|uniref:Lactonase, 7-bladed beta-propeller n=1 Tax=Mariniblastus fucicola TaxID=980251 RepID=A0A5B9PJJ9_9BACT|nr:hypothetical protein [Mariniblastus fucicola]QEG22831.1 hypothetical protein MFFC18_27160 [Mariniblastus fucicola]
MNFSRTPRLVVIAAMLATATLIGNLANADEIKLTSAGPIAFGPKGLLLISDPMEATIYAIETGVTDGSAADVNVEFENVRQKIASMLGADAKDVRINDLAIHPVNGHPYLSVSRGSGAEEASLILKIDPKTNAISEFDLTNATFTKTTLPNAAESKETRRGNQRLQAITDMAYVDGDIYVAGLSNEEFASNLRTIPYPFNESHKGSSIEIYHGAHGKFETRSPIRTFAALQDKDQVELLAAYTCTPLVRIPVGDLQPDTKVRGTTIAELGNRNRPLDMVVYKKGDQDFALMANSSRGVMKIDLQNVDSQKPIVERISGTAGVAYETIKDLNGVMQLDGLNGTHGVVLVREDDSSEHLKTIELP